MAYALAQVDGTAEPYRSFGAALWHEDRAVPAVLKELIFLRTSIINQCPT